MTETRDFIRQAMESVRFTPQEEIEIRKRLAEREAKTKRDHLLSQESRLRAPEWWTKDNYNFTEWIEAGEMLEKMCGEPKEAHSLLLMAPTNSGKSHVLCAIARALAGEQIDTGYGEKRYMTVYRIREHEFYEFWIASHKNKLNEEFDKISERAKNTDVLVYEDIGKTVLVENNGFSFTPFGRIVFSIFDTRAETRKINLVSSIYESTKLLQQAIGVDTMRRVVQMEGDIFRGRVLVKEAVQ
jgi:DNA replication protein DnaC